MNETYLGRTFKTVSGKTVKIEEEELAGSRLHVGKGSDGYWRRLAGHPYENWGRIVGLSAENPDDLVRCGGESQVIEEEAAEEYRNLGVRAIGEPPEITARWERDPKVPGQRLICTFSDPIPFDVVTPGEIEAENKLNSVLNLLQRDGHVFGTRPCETCKTISKMIERPFGCVLKAEQKK